MPRITLISWQNFEKFLFSVGCVLVREKGDHRIYWRADLIRPVVVVKEKQIPVFIIRNNLRVLKIDHEEYLKKLRS